MNSFATLSSKDFLSVLTNADSELEQKVARKIRQQYPDCDVSIKSPSLVQKFLISVSNENGEVIAYSSRIEDGYIVVQGDAGKIYLPL